MLTSVLRNGGVTASLVGQKLKIYHNGGIYSTANGKDSKFIEWKNEEIKTKAGKSHWGIFEPKTGDIGEVSNFKQQMQL